MNLLRSPTVDYNAVRIDLIERRKDLERQLVQVNDAIAAIDKLFDRSPPDVER